MSSHSTKNVFCHMFIIQNVTVNNYAIMQFKFFTTAAILEPRHLNSIFTVKDAIVPNVLQWQLVKEV